jgi:biotin synthase
LTLNQVRHAGLKVCCGGIIGMGEDNEDRIKMLVTLANLDEPPESVPINKLIRIPGTPLAEQEDVDPFDFVKPLHLRVSSCLSLILGYLQGENRCLTKCKLYAS